MKKTLFTFEDLSIGDRIKAKIWGKEEMATIKTFNETMGMIGVEFDEKIGCGHNLMHHKNVECKDGYGWYIALEDVVDILEKASQPQEEVNISGFKIGDKIVFDVEGEGHTFKKATVKGFDNDDWLVCICDEKFLEGHDLGDTPELLCEDGYGYYVYPSWAIEKLSYEKEEVQAPLKPKFKVGDMVKIPAIEPIKNKSTDGVYIKNALKDGQGFMYVSYIAISHEGEFMCGLNHKPVSTVGYGDLFYEEELELFVEEIKEPLFKIGDKVVMKTKGGKPLQGCVQQKCKDKDMSYAYVTGIITDLEDIGVILKEFNFTDEKITTIYRLDSVNYSDSGDYFIETDLEKYVPINKDLLAKIDDERIRVMQEDRKVKVALIERKNEVGVAICCPHDEFKLDTGIEIAYLRALRKHCDNELKLLTK